MGKIQVAEFLSLDGVMESPQNWHFPFITPDMQADVDANIIAADAQLYGRVTYDVFASFWPSQTSEVASFADKLNSDPKFVVSKTLKEATWNNTQIIRGDLTVEIPKLKQQFSGTIGLSGSATLVHSMMQADLIDEYWLLIHPIIVGKGLKLFQDDIPTAPLKLINSKTYGGGVTLVVYERDRSAN